jgi:glycine amidinotransferase
MISVLHFRSVESQAHAAAPLQAAVVGPVCSYNEWDPLEEVIVGVAEGACVPRWEPHVAAAVPEDQADFFQRFGGGPWPEAEVQAAARELEGFVRVLEAEGITVRRPSPSTSARPVRATDWERPCGLYAAMPRDVLLVVGDMVIEAPMAWRSRRAEGLAYRDLLKDYFRAGARWFPAPRAQMPDELYAAEHELSASTAESPVLAVREIEPVFDAADFVRFGRDLVAQRSHATNALGIEWVRRCLGPSFRVHEHRFHDAHPMHIDATLLPLAPGRLLVNPERVRDLPAVLQGWEPLPSPPSTLPPSHPMRMASPWVVMNVLSLDERRVVVEAHEEPLIRALEEWGFDPIPVPFRSFYTLGGSFHCATVDIRRRSGPSSIHRPDAR